eukprot:RCo008521
MASPESEPSEQMPPSPAQEPSDCPQGTCSETAAEVPSSLKRPREAEDSATQVQDQSTLLCKVCETAETPKYTAPCCGIKYCSAACFRKHKADSSECRNAAASRSVRRKPSAETTPLPSVPSGLLSTQQLKALESCAEIRAALRCKELQQLITNIDTAEDRVEMLDLARARIPEFAQFIETVLDVIYWTPSGGSEAPSWKRTR